MGMGTKKLVLVGSLLLAAGAARAEAPRVGLPWDWSHRAMIHRVDTASEAKAKGEYDRWERNFRDPRFARAVIDRVERDEIQAKAAARSAAMAKAAPGVETLIDHYYLAILGRPADAAGRAYHASEVERLAAAEVDRKEALRVVSKNFFFSPEYLGFNRSDADYLEDLYRAYLQRPADGAGRAFWLGELAAGLNREALMLAFIFSEEFEVLMDETLGYSVQRPETAVVLSAYRSALSRVPDQDGFTSWRDWLREGQCDNTIGTRAHEILFQFIQSSEYVARNRTSRQFVADLYDAIFRRSPDSSGFDFWARQLDSGAMSRQQVLEAFLASTEWQEYLAVLGEAGCHSAKTVPRDWSYVMGGAAGVGVKGIFPAKYTFDASATPDCVDDFVVYTTAAAGATSGASFATRTSAAVNAALTSSGGALGGLIRITNGARVLTLTLGATNTDLTFSNAASNALRAANIVAAINRNGGTVGVRASLSGSSVVVTALSAGAGGNSIVLAEGLNGFSWGGNPTGGAGTAGQPTIFALNQLYKTTCEDTAVPPVRSLPSVMWSYNTGTGNFAETSPIISLDGTQVAFMERAGAVVSLVLLKWSSTVSVGTIGAPTVPALAANAAAYRACAAPCMFKISTGQNNTRSSPYYDYINDELYVGSANGTLRKFTGVFLGNPAAAVAPWPVTVSTGNALSSPVYDSYSNLIYVGSARTAGTPGSGGQLHSVTPAGTLVSTSGTLAGDIGGNAGTGVAESPIVDGNAQRVYAFVATDNSLLCRTAPAPGGTADQCQAVYQFQTNLALTPAGQTPAVARIGRGGQVARTLKNGAFDNAYWTSAVASPTGFLYVCGSLGDTSDTDRPTLWRIPITANVMGAAVVGPGLTNAAGPDSEECSPITEVVTAGGVDQLYVSVPNASIFGCGGGGCMYRFDLSAIGTWATTAPTAFLAAPGGTGGIVIDNLATGTPGAAQIYYSTMTSPGNAIQARQADLN